MGDNTNNNIPTPSPESLGAPTATYTADNNPVVSTPSPQTTPPAPTPEAEPQPNLNQETYVSPKKRKIFPFILLFLLVLFLLLGGGFVYAAYSNVKMPFLNEEQQLNIQKWYAKIPLLPKNARHVMLLAIDGSSAMKTYEFKMSAGVDISQKQSVGGVSEVSFDFSSSGKADMTNRQDPKFDFDLQLKSASPVMPFSTKAFVLMADKKLYFKVDEFSGLPAGFIDLKPILGTWFKEDLANLDTEARKLIEKTQKDDKTVTEDTQRWFLKIFSDGDILSRVKMLKDEKAGDEMSYHLSFEPRKQDIIKVVNFIAEDQKKPLTAVQISELEKSLDSVEKLTIDVWIGQNTKAVRKANYAFRIRSPKEQKKVGDESVNLSPLAGLSDVVLDGAFSMEVLSVNKPVSINAPKDSKDISELLSFFGLSGAGSPSNRVSQAKDSGIKSDIGQIATGLESYLVTDPKARYPEKIDDLLTADLKRIPKHPMEGESYVYKPSKDRTNALLYGKLYLPKDPSKPYYVWDSVRGQFTEMSQAEIDAIVKADFKNIKSSSSGF